MNIVYGEPLSRGWNRMKKALFHPFDIAKWFTIGFTAFLAGLLDGGNPGGSGSGNLSDRYKHQRFDWEEFANYPNIAWEWLMTHPLWFTLIAIGIFFLIAISIVLIWLSSRGKFMFLDNVIHAKAEVVKPWHDYSRQGNSLFVWRLVYGFICFIIIMVSLGISVVVIYNLFTGNAEIPTKVFAIMGLILQFMILVILMSFISLFLNDFVVPIMYKHKISTSKAWFKFLPVLSSNLGHFIIYGLFIFVLTIIVIICVVIFGLLTCCIGFLFLIIPYIGSVVLLPISYTFRAFSLEFLGQFGDDFSLFPKQEELHVGLTEEGL